MSLLLLRRPNNGAGTGNAESERLSENNEEGGDVAIELSILVIPS